MDTIYGPVGHPTIVNGSAHTQFFIGRKSNYRSVCPCGKSDKDVHRCVEDEIRKLGAMDVLVSDRARSQISKKLHDVLRTFGIDDWQSEPHNKNQNFAERGWQDTKRLSNRVLDHSGAPQSAWFLALFYVCLLLNHVARKSLNWHTPIEWLLGYTPDITVLLAFMIWEPVYYKEVEPSFANTPEKYGQFVGISAGVGHSMTFIIYVESGDLIHRSAVRSARHGGLYTNIHAEGLSPSIAPKVRSENLNGEKNYDLPETRATIKERIPEDTIRGASDKATHSRHTCNPGSVGGNRGRGRRCGTNCGYQHPPDRHVHHVQRKGSDHRRPRQLRGVLHNDTSRRNPEPTVHSTRIRRRSTPGSTPTSRQEGHSPQSKWQISWDARSSQSPMRLVSKCEQGLAESKQRRKRLPTTCKGCTSSSAT